MEDGQTLQSRCVSNMCVVGMYLFLCVCVVCISVKKELTTVTLVGVMLLPNITRYTKKQT